MGKLINRIPGSRLLISSLPVSALRTHASRCQHAFSKPCLVNLISKDTHLVFSMSWFCDIVLCIILGFFNHLTEEGRTSKFTLIGPWGVRQSEFQKSLLSYRD